MKYLFFIGLLLLSFNMSAQDVMIANRYDEVIIKEESPEIDSVWMILNTELVKGVRTVYQYTCIYDPAGKIEAHKFTTPPVFRFNGKVVQPFCFSPVARGDVFRWGKNGKNWFILEDAGITVDPRN